MKRTNKLLLTMGTAAAIVAPVASVVACGTHQAAGSKAPGKAGTKGGQTPSQVGTQTGIGNPAIDPAAAEQLAQQQAKDAKIVDLKKQIADLYGKLEPMIQTMTSDRDFSAEIPKLKQQIADLTFKLNDLGFKAQRNVLHFDDVKADLTITNPDKAQLELIRVSDLENRIAAAIESATTLDEMKSYYPKYIVAHEQRMKITQLKEDLLNPPAPINKATEYKASPAMINAFENSFKDFFAGNSEFTTYSEFKSNPNNKIAKIGQMFGSGLSDQSDPDSFSINNLDFDEGLFNNMKTNIGFGMQQMDMEKGLVPHVDIKYDITKGTDEPSVIDFFKNLKINGNPMSVLVKYLSMFNAETVKTSDYKLFPFVYTDEKNPGYIHFAFFAYKSLTSTSGKTITETHHKSTFSPYNTFKSRYDGNASVKRGTDLMSEALGRDISKLENYYAVDSDFPKMMDKIYYAPKRDEMKYINEHITDADRTSLYWQLYDGGGFNTMASGRMYGIDLDKIYGTDGKYSPSYTAKGDLISDIKDLKRGATPGYQTQSKNDAAEAETKFRSVMKAHFSGWYLDQATPGRELPSLAQSNFGWRDATTYDLGSIIPFDRDANGVITGISDIDYHNGAQLVKGSNPKSTIADGLDLQEIADLHEAMYAMTDDGLGFEDEWRMGLDVWDHGAVKGRLNPFLSGLDIKYITVRNKDNKNDLDLVFKTSRNGKDLPTYKMTIPEGAMNWDQVDEAVKSDPVYAKPTDSQISKDDFEFLMMKVMGKWVAGGDAVASYVLPSVSKLLSAGLKTVLSLDEIDKYYDKFKNDNSVDLWRLNELVTNPDLDFMDIFVSEGADSTSRKTLYTKYGENLLTMIAKLSKQRILENPTGVDQDVIDSLTNEFEGL